MTIKLAIVAVALGLSLTACNRDQAADSANEAQASANEAQEAANSAAATGDSAAAATAQAAADAAAADGILQSGVQARRPSLRSWKWHDERKRARSQTPLRLLSQMRLMSPTFERVEMTETTRE